MTRKNPNIKRNKKAKSIMNGKSKTPIPTSIDTASKKINPAKNAFIIYLRCFNMLFY